MVAPKSNEAASRTPVGYKGVVVVPTMQACNVASDADAVFSSKSKRRGREARRRAARSEGAEEDPGHRMITQALACCVAARLCSS